MQNIREAQLKINEMNKAGEFTCPVHLALGHEAIAEAVSSVMTEDDQLLCTHRNIHYNIARADNLDFIIKQMKEGDGCMNMTNPEKGIVYTSSILGNNLSVACGCALAKKVKGDKGVVFVVTGDGAIEEGAFWEALIFAKTYKLRIIFIVENNGWSMSTSIEQRRCEINLNHFCSSVGVGHYLLHKGDEHTYLENLVCAKRQCQELYPICFEVHLTTLGGYEKDGRFINYHSGTIKDGICICPETCQVSCKGECGCEFHQQAYGDYLSLPEA